MRYIGLDFETTGVDVYTLRPIQIGIYIPEQLDGWGSYIYTDDIAENWSVAAESIHRIPLQVVESSPHVVDVDIALAEKLGQLGDTTLIPVGYGIGSFDMQILKRWMPRSYSRFGHRYLDLNATHFLDAGNDEAAFVKTKAREAMETEVMMVGEFGRAPQRHDAVSDAIEAILAMRYQQRSRKKKES